MAEVGRRALVWIEQHDRPLVSLVLALVLGAGALYSVRLGDSLRFQDERDFYAIAANLASGRGYSLNGTDPTAYRPPGYPLIAALLHILGARILALRLFNYALLTLTMLVLWRTVRRLDSPLAGTTAVVLVAAYPVFFFTASTLYAQTLGTFLLVCLFALITGSWNGPTWRLTARAGAIGALGGWLSVTVPGMAIVTLVAAAWLVTARRELRLGPRLACAGVIVAVAGVVALSWTARNLAVFRRPILMTTNSGITLLHGNSPHATANSGASTDISEYERRAAGLSELEQDDLYRRSAVEWIREHPTEAVRLYLLKVLNWLNYRNDLAQRNESTRLRDLLLLVTYVPLLVLAVFRLLVARRMPIRRFEVLLLLLYAAGALFYAIYHTRVRYRLPFDIGIATVAASFLAWLARGRPSTSVPPQRESRGGLLG